MSEEENWQVKLADELHKPIKRNFTRRRVIANHIDEIWCSDLVEMQQFSKWNKGYRYLLMVLDVFSKYGWIVPLKDKKGETVAEAFKKIFKEGRKPQYLWTDKGKEYYNKHVKELLDKNKITLYSTENEEKSSVCERWNRTIKTQMWKQFTIQGNTMYLDMLPKILKQYNNTKHSSIKMTPIEASKKKNESSIGDGGIGTKCAENTTRKKCAKIPRSNISGMSRSNFPRSNGKIKMGKIPRSNISGICGMSGMSGISGMPRSTAKVKNFRNVWNVKLKMGKRKKEI